MKIIKISEEAIINDIYLVEQLDTELQNRDYYYEFEEVRAAYKEAAYRYNITNLLEDYLRDQGYEYITVENCNFRDSGIVCYEIDENGIENDEFTEKDDIIDDYNEWIVSEWIDTLTDDAIEYLKEHYYSEDELDEEDNEGKEDK